MRGDARSWTWKRTNASRARWDVDRRRDRRRARAIERLDRPRAG